MNQNRLDFIALKAASAAFGNELPDNWEELSDEEREDWLSGNKSQAFEMLDNSEYFELIDCHADTIKEAIMASASLGLLPAPGQAGYAVAALNTAHLASADHGLLSRAGATMADGMVFERETGYFIKLYDQLERNLRADFSPELRRIVTDLHGKGYRMLEFDTDAPLINAYPTPEGVDLGSVDVLHSLPAVSGLEETAPGLRAVSGVDEGPAP